MTKIVFFFNKIANGNFVEKKRPFLSFFFFKCRSFWPFFDSQMAIFRRVSSSGMCVTGFTSCFTGGALIHFLPQFACSCETSATVSCPGNTSSTIWKTLYSYKSSTTCRKPCDRTLDEAHLQKWNEPGKSGLLSVFLTTHITLNYGRYDYSLYSHRQKKLDTSLNRRKMKSNKDRIDFKIGNKAEIHYNYFGVHNMMIGHL